MAGSPPSDLIRSVSRALRILEAVGQDPRGLSAKAVARRVGLPLATCYHLLRTLAYEGYLVRSPNGDYVVGLRIADRFADLVSSLNRRPAATEVLRTLAAATGYSTYLARFVGDRVTITTTAEGPRSPYLEDLIPGFHEAAHATALGKALLSTLDTGRRRAYLSDQGWRPFTGRTVVDGDRLDHELARCRAGVFSETCQFREEVSCLAVLVDTGEEADPWWAIGVSVPAPDFEGSRQALAAALQRAAAGLAA